MAPPGPAVGIGVFVFRSRQDLHFVFGVRRGSTGDGSYSLSGGHLEYGETFEQGAKREVKEETGLDVGSVKFLTVAENFFEEQGGKHYITLFVTAFVRSPAGSSGEQPEPQNLEPEKCDGWEWWTITQLRQRYDSDPESLFLPMRNLFEQRPEVVQKLEAGDLD